MTSTTTIMEELSRNLSFDDLTDAELRDVINKAKAKADTDFATDVIMYYLAFGPTKYFTEALRFHLYSTKFIHQKQSLQNIASHLDANHAVTLSILTAVGDKITVGVIEGTKPLKDICINNEYHGCPQANYAAVALAFRETKYFHIELFELLAYTVKLACGCSVGLPSADKLVTLTEFEDVIENYRKILEQSKSLINANIVKYHKLVSKLTDEDVGLFVPIAQPLIDTMSNLLDSTFMAADRSQVNGIISEFGQLKKRTLS